MVRERGLEDGVKFTGWVADEDKPSLYSMAEAFLFPSLYEGFGFPPLEAMACGCPVLASRSSSLPEVLGEAALLLDPNRPEDWAEGMEMVIKELDLAQSLREKGVERAKIFTWESAARNVLSILEEAARCGSP
jgi:glycosyltransferase involved in cell wall biosynthesis